MLTVMDNLLKVVFISNELNPKAAWKVIKMNFLYFVSGKPLKPDRLTHRCAAHYKLVLSSHMLF